MKSIQTSIPGAVILEIEKKSDTRGFLGRIFDASYLSSLKTPLVPSEAYTCATKKRGTVRGFHAIATPVETKLTRVIRGSMFEAILDLRPTSPTYLSSFTGTFAASEYRLLVTPPGCAHAILTLEDDTEYESWYTPAYNPSEEFGIRYNDPLFAVPWPIPVTTVSEKDSSWPDFKPIL